MTLNNFIQLYTNRYIDFDGIFPNQCMDLAHFYAYICLDIYDKSVLSANVAKNVWYNFNWNKYFTKIKNVYTDTTLFPKKGDIIIWDGTDGHIAVCVDANGNDFHSFDANYPTGSYPHIQYHNYINVIGWLHPINL
jgi:hypothetical protein